MNVPLNNSEPKIDNTLQLSVDAIYWMYNGYYLALKDIEENSGYFKSAKIVAATESEEEMNDLISNINIDEIQTFMWGDEYSCTISRKGLKEELETEVSKGLYENNLPANKAQPQSKKKKHRKLYSSPDIAAKIKRTIEKLRKSTKENYIVRDKSEDALHPILTNEALSLLDMAKRYYGYFLAIKNLTGNELSLYTSKAQIIHITQSKQEMYERMPELIDRDAELFIGLSYSASEIKIEFLRHDLIVSKGLSPENLHTINSGVLSVGLIHKNFDGCFLALTDVEEKWGEIYKARVLHATQTENEMKQQINELIDKRVETFMWGDFYAYKSYNYETISLPRFSKNRKCDGSKPIS